MYNGIRSRGGPYGWGGLASLYFIILVLFGNCNAIAKIIYF
jgi:hypothetical protein